MASLPRRICVKPSCTPLKQVLESNDMLITYYDITPLYPLGNYADHNAYMADVLNPA